MKYFALFALFTALVACSGAESATSDPIGETAESSDPSSGDQSPLSSAPGSGADVEIPGATFTLPEQWQLVAPSSSMRAAQAEIPGVDGAASLTVFFFGPGGGGGTDSNIERWIGQLEADEASPPVRESFSNGDTHVSWVEVEGTLKPSTMGMGPTEPAPGSMLLGGVVEGAGGPWFFKATGPASTLASQREIFLDMLRSVRVASAAPTG